jgi:hypothetical protein
MNNLTVAVILTFAVLTSAQETKKENPVKTALGIAAVSALSGILSPAFFEEFTSESFYDSSEGSDTSESSNNYKIHVVRDEAARFLANPELGPSLPLAKLLLAFRDGELKDRISQFNDFELTALLFNGTDQFLQTKGY